VTVKRFPYEQTNAYTPTIQIGPKVPECAADPGHDHARWGHMSGESMTTSFLNAA